MSVELLRDLERPNGWWLLVEGSEQSFVDTDAPDHLEFEYVQMIGQLLDTLLPDAAAVDALHLGGGLCTVPRWLAATRPGSRQTVVERSAEIAALSASIGPVPGTDVVVDDALTALAARPTATADVVVCDVYDGPDTVTSPYTVTSLEQARDVLRPAGLYVCNLSDATPFAMARTVAATVRAVFGHVVLLAEPPVLRGRRSGNVVLGAASRPLPTAELTRRAAGGAVRVRVVADDDLVAFIGRAHPALDETDVPASAESLGRPLR